MRLASGSRISTINTHDGMSFFILMVWWAATAATLPAADEFRKDTNQIQSLTAGQAEHLVATHADRILALGGLKSLPDDVTAALAAFDGMALRLPGVTELSAKTAHARAQSNAKILDLGGLTAPTDELADGCIRNAVAARPAAVESGTPRVHR